MGQTYKPLPTSSYVPEPPLFTDKEMTRECKHSRYQSVGIQMAQGGELLLSPGAGLSNEVTYLSKLAARPTRKHTVHFQHTAPTVIYHVQPTYNNNNNRAGGNADSIPGGIHFLQSHLLS